jgi:hypothetical protein
MSEKRQFTIEICPQPGGRPPLVHCEPAGAALLEHSDEALLARLALQAAALACLDGQPPQFHCDIPREVLQ